MAKTVSIRDKYKATPIATLKATSQEEDSMLGSGRNNEGYHKLEDGLNKMRIYPKKEDDKTFYHVRMQHWGSYEDEDDGELKRRSVNNARIHGGLKRDITEEYIKDAQAHIKATDDAPESAAKKLKAMTGDYKTSIAGTTEWVAWADKIKRVDGENVSELALWPFKRSVRDDLNTEAMMEDPDDVITVDPFTDPDEGKAVLVTYNSKAKKAADYYAVKLGKVSPLSDEQLEVFDTKPSLTSMLSNCYTMHDFDLGLKMLQHFDEKNEIGLFEEEAWLDKVKDMKKEVSAVLAGNVDPEGEDDDEPAKTTKKTVVKTANKKAAKVVEEIEEDDAPADDDEEGGAEETGDQFDEMTRKELIAFKAANELDIKCLKSDSDDDIREKIRSVWTEEDGDDEEEGEEDGEEAEEEVKTTTKKAAPAAGKESLSSIKERIMAGKKASAKK